MKGTGKLMLSVSGSRTGFISRILGYFNHGIFRSWGNFLAPGVLESDGLHLSSKGRRIVAHELAGLIERAVNLVQKGEGMKSGSSEMSLGVASQRQGQFLLPGD